MLLPCRLRHACSSMLRHSRCEHLMPAASKRVCIKLSYLWQSSHSALCCLGLSNASVVLFDFDPGCHTCLLLKCGWYEEEKTAASLLLPCIPCMHIEGCPAAGGAFCTCQGTHLHTSMHAHMYQIPTSTHVSAQCTLCTRTLSCLGKQHASKYGFKQAIAHKAGALKTRSSKREVHMTYLYLHTNLLNYLHVHACI